MPPKFFITHSWKDIDFTQRLYDNLRAHGLDGFFSTYPAEPGDLISREIERGLEVCDIYIPILSRAALQSPWCEEEINAASTLSGRPGRNGRPRIVSVLIEDCADALPSSLPSCLYILFEYGYDETLYELLTQGFGLSLAPPEPRIVVPPAPKIETLSHTIINPKDGKEMILIPAGEFLMGSREGFDDEKPMHKVYLDAFYISRYPVTNAEYEKFVDATKHSTPPDWRGGLYWTGKKIIRW